MENEKNKTSRIPQRHRIERRKLTDLAPWSDNPRTISDAALAGLGASVERFGLVQPLVFNERTGRLIGGHQRLRVLQEHGEKETDVVIVDLAETEEKALAIALNSEHITGEWTPDVRRLLDDLSKDFDAFRDLRFDTLLSELGKANLRTEIERGNVDEDESSPPPEKPKTRVGDLWKLGPHRLICGDSTDPSVVARVLDGGLADGMFTDPPYSVDYAPSERGRGRRPADEKSPARGRILNDALPDGEFRELLVRAFAAADTALKPGAPIYICGPAGWEARHFWAAWPEERWHFQAALVWDKRRHALSRWDFQPRHEVVFYGWRKGAKRIWLGKRDQSTVLEFEMGNGKNYFHPTQKPTALIRRLLLNSVPENGTVLDLFGGSGSTMIAAETCGRRACLVELDPRFVDAAVARWEKYTGEKAVREEVAS